MMNAYIRSISFLLLALTTIPVFAESAPVYDADSLPPFEQGAERNSADLPPPPPPEVRASPDDSGGFVPMQSERDDDAAFESKRAPASKPAVSSTAVTPVGSTAERLRRLEQQVANIQSSEKNVKLDSLQNQIQALRSDLDQLTHQMQQLQKQQKAQSTAPAQKESDAASLATNSREVGDGTEAAVSKKTADAKNSSKNTKAVKTKAVAADGQEDAKPIDSAAKTVDDGANAQPNVQEEQQIYQTAYSLIKSKKYTEAIGALKDMLKKYPSGQFASNAHYWLGELYGLSGKNDQALAEFALVVKDYPESPRVAEAQLKVGLIYAAQSKWADAKTSLKKVVTRYPGTTSARLASEQLKQIKQAGH